MRDFRHQVQSHSRFNFKPSTLKPAVNFFSVWCNWYTRVIHFVLLHLLQLRLLRLLISLEMSFSVSARLLIRYVKLL